MSDAVARDLERLVEGEVRFGRHDRLLYATDASIYQVEPLGVVVPRTIDSAARAVRYCVEHGLAILPRGGGTSLAGQAVNRAVVIDFSPHCNRITGIDPQKRTATVEPGVVLDRLNEAAAGHGLMFGPDVATSTHATLGGMVGNNSAGAHSILYGRTVEHLESLDVLSAGGEALSLEAGSAPELAGRVSEIVESVAGPIRDRYPRTTRRVNGYNMDLLLDQLEAGAPLNLAHLVCGAEGTLAVVTGATVRLVDVPRHKALAIAAFDSLDAALEALRPILDTGPAAVELIDDVIIGLAATNVECRRSLDLLPAPDAAAVLYVEYFGADRDEIDERLTELSARLDAVPISNHVEAAAMAAAWRLRKAGEPLLHAVPGDKKPLTFIEDTAVDPAKLPQFVDEFRRIVARHGTTASYYAHASVGCLHIRPMLSLRSAADRTAMQAIAGEVTDLVNSYRGALSGEHGDGRVRSHLLRRFYGDEICDAFGRIKRVFDPRNLLNPGNIVDPAPMLHALRVQPAGTPVVVPPVRTFYRYEAEHGFGSAVEMCNGAGVCRKTAGGTMCPSFRALRDERHSTRGRANALRLAITGQLGDSGRGDRAWDDPDTIETLDLCLSCKACKAECPSNVDVARLKAEYTAQRYAAAGAVPAGVRRFGHVRATLRRASAVAPLANAAARFAPTAALARRLLGIHPRRSLPPVGPSLRSWFAGRGGSQVSGPRVVLLPDCFTLYGEPRIGRAAVELLEAFGYRVSLPRAVGCCGRSLISNGMLADARRVCRDTAGALLAAADDAEAVVGCEPSCVSAITDDWPDLDLDLDRIAVRQLAARTLPVEQFIDARWPDHPRTPPFTGGPPRVLAHGHCHAKALWGDEWAGLLRRLLGSRLTALDTGCCGMAGAFGYTSERYDLSMAIGELALLPAVRAEPGAAVAAAGTSCRHQLRDGAAVEAVHPIEIARSMVDMRE